MTRRYTASGSLSRCSATPSELLRAFLVVQERLVTTGGAAATDLEVTLRVVGKELGGLAFRSDSLDDLEGALREIRSPRALSVTVWRRHPHLEVDISLRQPDASRR